MEVERDADVDADDGPHNGGSACSSGECPMLSACERRKTDDLSVGILTEESTAISSKQGVTDLIEKGTVDLVEEGTACLTGEGIAVPIEEETTDPTEEETVCSMEEGTAGPTEEGTVDSMGERKAGTKEEMKAGTKEERRAGTEEERTAKEVEKEALGITMERLGASDEEKLEILDFEGNDDGNDDSQVSEIEAARSDDDCDDDIFNVDLLSRDEGSSTEVPPEKVRDIVASGSNTAPATAAMTPSTSATVKTADRSVATSSTGPCDNLEVVDLLDSDEEDEEASIGGSQKIQATQKQEDGGAETIGWSEAEKFASNKNTPKLNSWSATPTMYPGSHYYGQPPSINGNNPPIEMPSPYNGGYHSHPAPPHNNVHFHHYGNHQYQRTQLGAPSNSNGHRQHHQHSESNRFSNSKPPTVEFIPLPSKFLPTWSVPIPPEGVRIPEQHVSSSTGCLSYSPLASRRFRLSLLSMTEFTISAVSLLDGDFPFHLHYNGTTAQSGRRGTSTPYLPHNLGIKVRKMARAKSVKAVYETYDDEDANCTEERWRLPLAIYHDLYVFLISPEALSGPIRNVQIDPISSELLKMASLGSEWSGRDFPDPEDLHQRRKIKIELAMRLAPFQRGGVDFIAEKNGNALLADEMGLGKTVQAIASMSLFHEEWPLLVLTPSSTRFHWKHEFQFWLGKHSSLYTEKKKRMIDGSDFSQPAKKRLKKMTDVLDKDDTLSKNTCAKDDKKDDGTIPLLKEKQIHVISSGKDLWSRNSRVVICSYGLIPSLAKRGFLKPGTFRCCIVDESHMLKNMSSKRTATLLPILKETTRCLMLSGTPAFAKPIELFPQLNILGRGKWWNNEAEYRRKYCLGNRGSAMGGNNLGELHALLSSTVMLRRLKADMLKNLPQKKRERAYIKIGDCNVRQSILEKMTLLRKSKGAMGTLAVRKWQKDKQEGRKDEKFDTVVMNKDDEESRRKTLLNDLYKETGLAKIPVVLSMLSRWISDPSSGKLCIFAHHIEILNAMQRHLDSKQAKYMRIDGGTSPSTRQKYIDTFQENPHVRVAILGLTAAGVGVTLTASSTVWFAEMFWTPAIMLQAEDRCHRIGQQSIVRCVYLIGKHTLDELLWALMDKKVRSLGEMVEGKHTSIVLHQDGRVIGEEGNLFRMKEGCSSPAKGSEDENEGKDDGESADDEILSLADNSSLQNDLVQLAKEDLVNYNRFNNEDEEMDLNVSAETRSASPSTNTTTDKTKASNLDVNGLQVKPAQASTTEGLSEKDAILLSDDDDDDVENNHVCAVKDDVKDNITSLSFVNPYWKLPRLKVYKITFFQKPLGINIAYCCGRVVLNRVDESHVTSFLGIRKPSIGDFLISINNFPTELNTPLRSIASYIATHPMPLQLVFGEDLNFTSMYLEKLKAGAGIAEAAAALIAKCENKDSDECAIISSHAKTEEDGKNVVITKNSNLPKSGDSFDNPTVIEID